MAGYKIMTLPPGYTIDNSNNFGTITTVNEQYRGSISNLDWIRNELGLTIDSDLSEVNTSDEINVWAAFKPAQDGTIDRYGMGFSTGNLVYLPRATKYNLSDWIGYNPNATSVWATLSPAKFSYDSEPQTVGMLLVLLPEFDFNDIVYGMTHLYADVYIGENLQHTRSVELTTALKESKSAVIDGICYVPGGQTADFDYECKLYLGNSTRSIENNFPKPDLSSGPYTVSGSAERLTGHILGVVVEDFETGYIADYQNALIDVGENTYSFALKIFHGPDGVSGTCSSRIIYNETSYTLGTVSFTADTWVTNNGDFPSEMSGMPGDYYTILLYDF